MTYRPYANMTDGQIRAAISTHKYQIKNIKPPCSGQVSNYHMPALHYLEEELKRRGVPASEGQVPNE